jgi:telomeric repeat-binding factor 2
MYIMELAAGEEKAREILGKLEESTSRVNLISTPEFSRVVDALKTSCAELHSVVEDPLPAAKAAADEVLATRVDRAVNLNAETGQPAACGTAGPSALHEKNNGTNKGTPPSLMDWNPTAQTFQVSPPSPAISSLCVTCHFLKTVNIALAMIV